MLGAEIEGHPEYVAASKSRYQKEGPRTARSPGSPDASLISRRLQLVEKTSTTRH